MLAGLVMVGQGLLPCRLVSCLLLVGLGYVQSPADSLLCCHVLQGVPQVMTAPAILSQVHSHNDIRSRSVSLAHHFRSLPTSGFRVFHTDLLSQR